MRNFYGVRMKIFSRVNGIEAIYEKLQVNAKVDSRSTVFTFTRDLSYSSRMLFRHVTNSLCETACILHRGDEIIWENCTVVNLKKVL